MWLIAKVNTNESSVFKRELVKKMSTTVNFYEPKIFYEKNNSKKIKKILGNYIFCFNSEFKDLNSFQNLQYIKGLGYFLKDSHNSQKNITQFISMCRKYEDKNGFLIKDYFKKIISLKYKFLNGPLANLIFEILKKNKNNFEINVSDKKIQLRKNSKIFYLPA